MFKYETHDYEEMVILYCLENEIDKIINNNGQISFQFKNKKECERKVLDFHNNKLEVEPTKFFRAMKKVKQLIYNNK